MLYWNPVLCILTLKLITEKIYYQSHVVSTVVDLILSSYLAHTVISLLWKNNIHIHLLDTALQLGSWEIVLLCSPGWLRTHCSLCCPQNYGNPPASTQMESQAGATAACANMFNGSLFKFVLFRYTIVGGISKHHKYLGPHGHPGSEKSFMGGEWKKQAMPWQRLIYIQMNTTAEASLISKPGYVWVI